MKLCMQQRISLAALMIVFIVILALPLHDAARGTNWLITMGNDDRFHPDFLSMVLGDSVTWMNADTDDHTSTSGPPDCTPDGTWDSGLVAPGGEFLLVPAAEGTFPFFCSIHCQSGMVGTLEVQPSTPAENDTWGKIKSLFKPGDIEER